MLLNDPRTNFLFWNLQKKPLTQNIVRIAESHDVHVLLFAETAFQQNAVLENALNAGPRPAGADTFSSVAESRTSRIQIVSRLKHPQWMRKITRKYYDVWSMTTDAGHVLFLAAVHFPSIQVDQGDGQRKTAMELRTDVENLKSEDSDSGECRVIVCGDFNASPFDAGIVGVYGLNASPSREVVQRSGGRRTLHERSYPYLYNPMWRLLGGSDGRPTAPSAQDQSPKIYGTYYTSSLSKSVDPFWYTLDQVLVSPSLLPSFRDEELRVLTRDADAEHGGVSFVSQAGIPKTETYSDHLPLVFSVHL